MPGELVVVSLPIVTRVPNPISGDGVMKINLWTECAGESFTVVSVTSSLHDVKVEGVWAKSADEAEEQCKGNGFFPVAVFKGFICAL